MSQINSRDQNRFEKEIENIRSRYLRRDIIPSYKYSPLNPAIFMINQEKERAFIKWLKFFDLSVIEKLKLLEIGCGGGQNLMQFIKLGFTPDLLVGNELLSDRVESAKKKLPAELEIIEGNALEIDLPSNSFDIVFQSMVFSSILNKEFKFALAQKMLQLVKPCGGVLWYDFIYNNPKNPDVKGIPFREVQALFPNAQIKKWRI
ncbi:MAG: class I SAM-dependent methyltransferase, partial [Ignavibacteria bacterium]|nr:class I SAM-dependent methyltransferase [Ignavibacteria bacterium]